MTVRLKRKKDVGGPCDCGVPIVPVDDDDEKKKKNNNNNSKGCSGRSVMSGKSTGTSAASERKRREQGAKVFVSRCLCQGTPERRIFDKYIDPLDG